jgi:S1-C subfamily serine protease
LGASFADVTLESPVLGVKAGVRISSLKNGKLKQAGVREGFIILIANDEPIASSDQLEKFVESVMKNDPDYRGLFVKGIYPNGKITYYAIDLND